MECQGSDAHRGVRFPTTPCRLEDLPTCSAPVLQDSGAVQQHMSATTAILGTESPSASVVLGLVPLASINSVFVPERRNQELFLKRRPKMIVDTPSDERE